MADVRVDGLSVLLKQLENLAAVTTDKDARKPVSNALRKCGQVVQISAKSIVHKRSGALRDNIIVSKRRKPDFGYIEMQVTVRYKARKYVNSGANRRAGRVGKTYEDYGPFFYARFLEFGTSKRNAYPFMLPAWDANKELLPELFKQELALAIEQAVAKT